MRIDGPKITGSFSLGNTVFPDLNSLATTASINSLSSSVATTGSNLFKGTQTLSGSILPAVNNTYDLGSPTQQFRHVYISTGSLYIDGTKVLGSTSSELQITTDVGQSFKVLETGADTITLQSADGNVTLTSTGGGDVVIDPNTGVIGLKGTVTIYTGNKIVSSDGNAIQFGNGIAITGSIVATGTSLVSGSSQVLNGSGVWSGSAQLPSGIISGSSQVLNGSGIWSGSSQLPNGIVSSSAQVTGYGFSTTGSNNFIGTQTITGSLYISQNLIVQGSSSLQDVTGSNVYIGTNKINLNTATPSIRFGGISVFDSGSNFGESGSLLWDSQNNRWLYQHPASSGAPYKSAIIIAGPQNSGSLGSETTLTSGKISKAVGDDHIGDSIMTETGGGIGISGSLSITGSIVATGTSLWSGSGQLPSGVVSGSAQIVSSLPNGTVSGSSQVLNGTTIHSGSFFNGVSVVSGSAQVDVLSTTNIARLATTGSNIFTAGQIISSSVAMPIELWHPDGNGIRFRNAGSSGKSWDVVSSGNNFVINETGVSGRLFISSSGNFGFNTTSPSQKISIVGGATSPGSFSGGNYYVGFISGSVESFAMGTDANFVYLQSFSSKPLKINNQGNNVIFDGGSVAIGKSSPNTTLDLNGNMLITGSLGISTPPTSSFGLSIKRTVGSDGALRLIGNDNVVGNCGINFYNDNTTSGSYISMYTNGGLNLNGVLSISGSNVGIGTIPSYPIDMTTSSSGTFNTIAQFQNTDYTSGNKTFIRVRTWASAGGSYSSYFGTGQDGNLYMIANNSARGGDLIINAGTGAATFSSSVTANALSIGSTTNSTNPANGSAVIGGGLGLGGDIFLHQASSNGSNYGYIKTNPYTVNTTQLILGTTYGYGVNVDALTLFNGNATIAGTITENSSIRYKENIEQVRYGLDKVLQMRGVTYTKKDTGLKELGLIAEEVNEIIPEIVLKNEEGEPDSVSYGRITAVLIEAIKDLKKEIEELKSNK